MLGMEAKVDSLKQGLESIKKELEKATREDLEKAAQAQPYRDAKRRLEESQRFLALLDAKIASERLLEDLGSVEIVDRALPPLQSISPNRLLATILIAAGLLLDMVGLLLLKTR